MCRDSRAVLEVSVRAWYRGILGQVQRNEFDILCMLLSHTTRPPNRRERMGARRSSTAAARRSQSQVTDPNQKSLPYKDEAEVEANAWTARNTCKKASNPCIPKRGWGEGRAVDGIVPGPLSLREHTSQLTPEHLRVNAVHDCFGLVPLCGFG